MLAAEPRQRAKALIGSPLPRIAPPVPLKHGLGEYQNFASDLDITPMPWQDTAAKYLTARAPDKKYLYREVAVVVGRQNGKTTLVKPLIVQRLKAGRHIMHIAQVRELPRIMFEMIADALEASDPGLFPKRRGKIIWPRRGAGSESIVLTNGGSYRIAAAVTGSARGHSIDDLIIDELREMETWDVINSAKPAQRFADDPQTIYLSNMGTEQSVVLNSLKTRAAEDRSLAYLEWSADGHLEAGDHAGWVQANPSIGHYPQVLRDLEKDYVAAVLGGNLEGFEAEALCRRVPSMEQRLVTDDAWAAQEFLKEPGTPVRAAMGVSMDSSGERASVVIAWVNDEHVILDVHDTQGSPIDVTVLGPDIAKLGISNRVIDTAYDPYTDVDLARYLRKAKAINGRDYGNASEKFVRLVTERKLRIHDPKGVLTEDLRWTTRRSAPNKSYMAVRANDEHSNTAVLAAIRATWLATNPNLQAPLRMH